MMRDAGANTPEENRADSERLDRLFNGLWAHPCFTVGAVQGVALGGGAGLVACCDYVVATQNVRIALSEGKLGILPAVIGPYVYRRLGSATFRRLAMQASRVQGDEAPCGDSSKRWWTNRTTWRRRSPPSFPRS